MEPLPMAQGDELTEKEIKAGLEKMSKGKAYGLDNIPVTVYKNSEVCNKMLIELLQKIWRTEEVPEEISKTSFVMLFKNKDNRSSIDTSVC